MKRWISGVAGQALAGLLLAIVGCGGSASRADGKSTAGSSPKATSAPAEQLPGTIGAYRLYPVAMDYDDHAQVGVTFGPGFRWYRVNLVFVNGSDRAVNLAAGPHGFFVYNVEPQQSGGGGARQLLGMSLVSADPYTYTNFTEDLAVPGRHDGNGKVIPPGFSDLVAALFGVAVTAHPPFHLEIQAPNGQPVPVALQSPLSAALVPGALNAGQSTLTIGSLQATLLSAGASSMPDSSEANGQAGFILAGNPKLKTLRWVKASWNVNNAGGQNDYASFASYLITDAAYLHPADTSAFDLCCSIDPGQSKSANSFWALTPAEGGAAYVVLLGVRRDGSPATGIWKVH